MLEVYGRLSGVKKGKGKGRLKKVSAIRVLEAVPNDPTGYVDVQFSVRALSKLLTRKLVSRLKGNLNRNFKLTAEEIANVTRSELRERQNIPPMLHGVVGWEAVDYSRLTKPVLAGLNLDVVKGGIIKNSSKVIAALDGGWGAIPAPLVLVSHNGRPLELQGDAEALRGLSLEPVVEETKP